MAQPSPNSQGGRATQQEGEPEKLVKSVHTLRRKIRAGKGKRESCYRKLKKIMDWEDKERKGKIRSLEKIKIKVRKSGRVYSTGFWQFFGFFSKMNMESPKVHHTGGCRENQALCNLII